VVRRRTFDADTPEHPWRSLADWIARLWHPDRAACRPRLGPGGQALAEGSSRQQRRAVAFRVAFARASDLDSQTGGEPRRARRRIARAWAKREAAVAR